MIVKQIFTVPMEGLKEFLTPTRFSLFGYIVAIVYFFAGVVFVGITSKLRLNERRTFLCDFSGAQPADKLFLQAQCFDKYEQHYNSPLPLYVFVLLNFATVIVVCLVYSWCCVKSRVDKLQAAVIPDAENPRPRPRVETRCIFSCISFISSHDCRWGSFSRCCKTSCFIQAAFKSHSSAFR